MGAKALVDLGLANGSAAAPDRVEFCHVILQKVIETGRIQKTPVLADKYGENGRIFKLYQPWKWAESRSVQRLQAPVLRNIPDRSRGFDGNLAVAQPQIAAGMGVQRGQGAALAPHGKSVKNKGVQASSAGMRDVALSKCVGHDKSFRFRYAMAVSYSDA
ncbi:hypothetical protein [Rhodophyticola sp. CCM32]|uniref:hypothetical protein n=1 Tax=Rhodophyticola sp. CCM32 TaxID=2916397 RepID=UPI003FCF4E9A